MLLLLLLLPQLGDPAPKGHSYIASSYVKMIESAGARAVPILCDMPAEEVKRRFKVGGWVWVGVGVGSKAGLGADPGQAGMLEAVRSPCTSVLPHRLRRLRASRCVPADTTPWRAQAPSLA